MSLDSEINKLKTENKLHYDLKNANIIIRYLGTGTITLSKNNLQKGTINSPNPEKLNEIIVKQNLQNKKGIKNVT